MNYHKNRIKIPYIIEPRPFKEKSGFLGDHIIDTMTEICFFPVAQTPVKQIVFNLISMFLTLFDETF
jgi:hypothetical protein